MLSQEVTAQNEDPGLSSGCLRSLLDVGNVPPPETSQLRYFEPTSYRDMERPLRHVLVPQLKFTCHGVITSYSALTVVQAILYFLLFAITFVVWRPRGLGVYDLVGYSRLLFSGRKLRNGIFEIDNSTGLVAENEAFFEFTKEPALGEPILFQPGDVLGWVVISNELKFKPLSLVYNYREATSNNTVDGFDVFTTLTSIQRIAPCSVSECDAIVSRLSSILCTVQLVATNCTVT